MEKIVRTVMSVRRRHSFAADMFTSFIITFAAAVFTYDTYMPKEFMKFFGAAVLWLCILTWLCLSFLSGAYQKYRYMVFMLLFWLIPQIIIYAADSGPEIFRMSIVMYLLSEFSDLLTRAPAGAFGAFFSLGALPSLAVIVLLCVFSCLAGMLLSDSKTWKKLSR